ncbi:MAG: hypothetical protein U5K51_15735 [Flavobacteriaceae bacterium]|nr:hypothetical protein [Flavobacteriaceae bacterium]
MRNNYEKAYNIDSRDGDFASTNQFNKMTSEEEEEIKPRMYNAPQIPRQIGESGLIIQQYDTKMRNRLY